LKLTELSELEPNRDAELIDAWGRPIQYSVSGLNVMLKSAGKDGVEGGVGENADIERDLSFSN
jgi:Type II secretion system (T2SS), protein G